MLKPPPYYAQRIGFFYAGYFTVSGVQLPFFPVWLHYRGLTEDQIAAAVALPLFLRVLLAPLGGWLADRAPNRRFAIRIYTGLAFVIFLFAGSVDGFWPILAVTTASLMFWNIALPAAEALALTGVRRYGLDYGRMRLYGSAAFIVANIAGGIALSRFAPGAIFWALAGVLLLSALFSLSLPVTPRAVRVLDDAAREERAERSPRFILGNPVFLALMAAGGLLQASHAMLYGFGSLHWESRGFTGTEIGALWATGVLAEIALFSMSGAVARRLGAGGLILAGGIGALVRWSVFPLDIGLGGYFGLQLLHGLSFGASFLGTQMAILHRVPESITGTAQSISSMIGGLMMAGATAAAGPLYRNLGAEAFLIMLAPAAAALVLLGLSRLERRAAGAAGGPGVE